MDVEVWNGLAGRTALVTGGASGIGFGIAEAVVEAGGRVLLADIEQDRLNSAIRRLQERFPHADCEAVVMDVSDRESVAAAADQMDRGWDMIDVLVNNAGVAFNATPTIEAPEQSIDWLFAVNVQGVLNCIQAFVPHLVRAGRGGRVLNTSSLAGFQVRPGRIPYQTLYAATKYAIVAISEGLDIELRPHGIAVSVLAPANVATDIATADRNRPDRFGGPTTGSQTSAVARVVEQGMPPIKVGRLAVRGVMEGAPYIFAVHAADLDFVKSRHRGIETAIQRWSNILEETADGNSLPGGSDSRGVGQPTSEWPEVLHG